MNDGIERRVTDEVMCDVDLESFMLRDRRGEGMQDVGEGWQCVLAQLASCYLLARSI